MVRKRIAAVVALSLVGVVPAGLAWADPKDEPNGCKNETPKRQNPNCDKDPGERPGHRTGQQSPPPQEDPTFLFDSHDLKGGGKSGSDLPVRVQAIQDSKTDTDERFDDGGSLVVITVNGHGTVLNVAGSQQKSTFTVDGYNGNVHLSRDEQGNLTGRVAGQKLPSQP